MPRVPGQHDPPVLHRAAYSLLKSTVELIERVVDRGLRGPREPSIGRWIQLHQPFSLGRARELTEVVLRLPKCKEVSQSARKAPSDF